MKTNNIIELLKKADALYELQEYHKAIDTCKTIIELDPDNESAFETQSVALLMLDKNTEAVRSCDDGIEINPTNLHLLNTKGVALERLNRYQEAVKIFSEILRLDPQNEQVRLNIEHAKASLNEYKKSQISVTKPYKSVTKNTPRMLNEPRYASSGKRLLNWLIDSVCWFVAMIIVFASTGLEFQSSGSPTNGQRLVGLLLFISYYVLFESIWQKTPGKWVTKTRVIMEDDTKPDFAHILGRTMSRLIPFDALSFLGKGSAGWHDKISRTRVINEK